MKALVSRFEPIQLYAAGVVTAGLALFVAVATRGLAAADRAPSEFWVLTVFVMLGELLSIKVRRGNEVTEEITTSTTFSYALVLGLGTGAGVLAQSLASVLGDIVRRKSPLKTAFNWAQYTLSLGAAGGMLAFFANYVPGGSHTFAEFLPAFLLSAAAFFVVNSTLTNLAVGLAEGFPLKDSLRLDLEFQGFIDAILLGLSPIVVDVAENDLWLIPLLTLPMAAVARSARRSAENEELVDELRCRADENEHQALHDGLTGLPNRTLFHDRVKQAIATAQREGSEAAVMIMDLDRFKEINDTLGHHNGDVLLRQVAARLGATLRESDTIARLGGDEFAILLPKLTDGQAAIRVAEKILEALDEPIALQEINLEIDASLGISLFPANGEDVDTLLVRADVAMYAAKQARGGYALYNAEQDQYSPDRLALIGELRRALDEDALVVVYQPQADLRGGQVTGVEALVRWQHPRHGLMPPNEFIPMAEHTGMIRPLTFHVLNQALRQAHLWKQQGLHLSVAVNLSVQNLLDVQLPNEVAKLLKKWHIEPRMLELEITESGIMGDPVRSLEVLTELSGMGIGLTIDDYGTGYSSLSYLRRLPIDCIKIDRSFVMGMDANENDAVIVRSTVDLGRNLGLHVVAEGVENDEVWSALRDLRCDSAQGYFLSRPLFADDFSRWMNETPGQAAAAGADVIASDGAPHVALTSH